MEPFFKEEPQDIKRENEDQFVKTEPRDIKAEYEEQMFKAEDIKEEEYDPGEKRTDDGSRPFFHENHFTNTSVREKPDEVMKSVGELMLSKCLWKEYKTKKSGKVFYHNNHTKESVWTIPKELQDIKDRIKAESKRKSNGADHVPYKFKVIKKTKPESTAVLEFNPPVSNKKEPAETRHGVKNPNSLGRKLEKEPDRRGQTKCPDCCCWLKIENLDRHLKSRCPAVRQARERKEREKEREEKAKVEREKVEAFKARVRGAEEAAARARQNLSRAANPTFETFESLDQVLDEDVAEDMFSWSPPPSP